MLTLVVCSDLWAQRVVISNVSLEGEEIKITYDIFPKSSSNEKYDVEVLSSSDNYSQPLQIVGGPISDVAPGSGLSLTIDGPSNFSGYSGDLDFQIRARISFLPLQYVGSDKVSAKRGKTVQSNWEGVVSSDSYTLQLVKNGVFYSTISENVRQNSASWSIPSDHDIGSGFELKLISNSDRSISASSPAFSIKRKVPTFVKILPVAAVGGAAFVVLGGGSSSNLPEPPALPEG